MLVMGCILTLLIYFWDLAGLQVVDLCCVSLYP